MDGLQPLEPHLQRVRQLLIGAIHIGEEGVAHGLRDGDRIEQRRARRLAMEGVIAMPVGSGAVASHQVAVAPGVGERVNLGAVGQAVGADEERLELAEHPGEVDELARRQLLLANR